MTGRLSHPHIIFPVNDIGKTARYYEDFLGFKVIYNLEHDNPYACLYRDECVIILTHSANRRVVPVRELYGYGYDAFFMSDDLEGLEEEFRQNGVKVVKPFSIGDLNFFEFVIEDLDGRWIAFGLKGLL